VRALCTLPGGGVPATYLSSQQSGGDRAAVHRELSNAAPSCKLLYVTPVSNTVDVDTPRRCI
jgi:hypothetical protein